MTATADHEPDIERLALWLKALAEPQRLRIMRLLIEGIQCNCELGNSLDMAPNLIRIT
ncbi:MAG: ArsR/SmtB family transcription factor [Roseiflexus sp.]